MMARIRKWLFISALLLNVGGGLIVLLHIDLFFTVKVLYYFNFIVFPCILSWTVLAHSHAKENGKRPWKYLGASVLLFGLYIYASYIEPGNLKVREITIEMPGITTPITIAHLSDIQSDHLGDYEMNALKRIKAAQPDLIIHTGDLVQSNGAEARIALLNNLIQLLQEVDFGQAIYNVYGDTDHPDEFALVNLKANANVVTLDDEHKTIGVKGQKITLTGLDLASSRSDDPYILNAFLENVPENNLHIVMGHAPDYALHLDGTENVLALAGHTHGGQVRLPWFGPILTLSNVPRDWARGHTQIGNCHLNVSAGIGAEHASGLPSIRFNCPPEFTILHLIPST